MDARLLGKEAYLNKQFRSALVRQGKAQRTNTTIQKATPYMMETFAISGMLAILAILVGASESLEDTLPMLVLLGVATLRLKQWATRISVSVNRINTGRASIPTIVGDFNELSALAERREGDAKAKVRNG